MIIQLNRDIETLKTKIYLSKTETEKKQYETLLKEVKQQKKEYLKKEFNL